MPEVAVRSAASSEEIAAAAALFRAYAAGLSIDLGYQGFEAELASLPGAYAPPGGALLLARATEGAAFGCVAVRPGPGAGSCEMKRLYVAPAGRGRGTGRALVAAAIAAAEAAGWREMLLDTLPEMAAAQALYRDAGFEPAAAYYPTPVAGTVFMRRALSPARRTG